MRRLLVATMLFAACHGAKGDAHVVEQPRERSDALVADVAPLSVMPPEVTEQDCVDYREADRVSDEVEDALIAVEKAEAQRRGWRLLEEYRVAEFSDYDHGELMWRDGFAVEKTLKDRVIDAEGNHWLAVEESGGCRSFDARFYVNEANQVFTTWTSPQCADTVKLDGCGSFPGEGCGVKPEFSERRFVRVPPRAKLLAPVSLAVPTTTCYSIEPIDGIDHPP